MQQNGKRTFLNHIRHWKLILLSAGILLLVMCSVTYMMAWMTAKDKLENEFDIGAVAAEIIEDFDGSTKSNVKVQNTGNTEAYVRAVVSVYWTTDDGGFLADIPVAGTDYTITYGSFNNWQKEGNIYYYLKPLKPGDETDNLIDSCVRTGTADGKKLNVDISVQTIQADPADAVETAWDVQVGNDGSLTFNNP